jgi:hypothetical protein
MDRLRKIEIKWALIRAARRVARELLPLIVIALIFTAAYLLLEEVLYGVVIIGG